MRKVNLKKVVGTSAFALAMRNEFFIRAFIENVLANGYNTIRVGSETADWGGGWCPKGPDITTKAARQNLERLLKVASEYPIWIQLISSFTIKYRSHEVQMKWAAFVAEWVTFVAEITGGNPQVFLSAVNEYRLSPLTTQEVIELR